MVHNRPSSYCKFGNFRGGFIFAKLRRREVSRKKKPSRNREIILSFNDVSLSCNVANMSFNAIRENKIVAKISEFTVHWEAIIQRNWFIEIQLANSFVAKQTKWYRRQQEDSDQPWHPLYLYLTTVFAGCTHGTFRRTSKALIGLGGWPVSTLTLLVLFWGTLFNREASQILQQITEQISNHRSRDFFNVWCAQKYRLIETVFLAPTTFALVEK